MQSKKQFGEKYINTHFLYKNTVVLSILSQRGLNRILYQNRAEIKDLQYKPKLNFKKEL